MMLNSVKSSIICLDMYHPYHLLRSLVLSYRYADETVMAKGIPAGMITVEGFNPRRKFWEFIPVP